MLNNKKINLMILAVTLGFSSILFAQHRGDNLIFQGLDDNNDLGVKAVAMGGAYTSVSGDLSAMFYNPAGLIGINKLQVSIAGNYFTKQWRENQNYRPNRLFVTLPFYLEGLYIPDPAEDGMLDHLRMWTSDRNIDSTYYVSEPKLGQDSFSEEAADWKKEINNSGINNIAAAMPLNFGDHKFVVSAAYSRSINIEDFDRNDTYLDPHPGYTYYGDIARVNGKDTINLNWYEYLRERSGKVDKITAALAYSVNENINVGIGMNYNWGSSDDKQYLKNHGIFNLVDQNRFIFSYTNGIKESSGTSDYSYSNFFLGLQLELQNFSAGVKVDLPYSIERKWEYTELIVDSLSSNSQSESGIDNFDIPATFNVGISFKPVNNFVFSVDYNYQPFSKAEFSLGSADTTFKGWQDKNVIKVGAEYKPYEFLSLMAGYRNIPSVFIPDGSAIKDAGPKAESYTFGVSLNLFFGRFDIAYELRNLRYYDSYYSNTNYATETYRNLLFGYVLSL